MAESEFQPKIYYQAPKETEGGPLPEREEEERYAWQLHERAMQQPELRRLSILYYPEALRVETRKLMESMVQAPSSTFDRWYWMRVANGLQERARILGKGKTKPESDLYKILRLKDIPDPSLDLIPRPPHIDPLSDYEKARLKPEETKSVEEQRAKDREQYKEKTGRYEVLRHPLAAEYNRLGKEFSSVVKIANLYLKHHGAGSFPALADVYVNTPFEFQLDADDLEIISKAPEMILRFPEDKEGKEIKLSEKREVEDEAGVKKEVEEVVYPISAEIAEAALKELGRDSEKDRSLGQNIDKTMRLCLLVSLSEDPEEIEDWMERTKKKGPEILRKRIIKIEEAAKKDGRELTKKEREKISNLHQMIEDPDPEEYWYYLLGIARDKREHWIGDISKLKKTKDRQSYEDVYKERISGVRGKLIENGNIWSLARRGSDKDKLRKYLIEIVGGDELAVDLGIMMHIALGTSAQFGAAKYKFDEQKGRFTEVTVEGAPYMTEDVRAYNFPFWQIYKGQAGGLEGSWGKLGPFALCFMKHLTTWDKDENGAHIYEIKKDEDDEGIRASLYERIENKKKIRDYYKVDEQGKIIDPQNPTAVAVIDPKKPRQDGVKRTKDTETTLFDLWTSGVLLQDIPWKETVEDPWRVWMLRLFFAGRVGEKYGGLHDILTKTEWNPKILFADKFWEDFKLATKVLIRKTLIYDSDFWKDILKRMRVQDTQMDVVDQAKIDVDLIKGYIYKTWWEGIKSTFYFKTWQETNVTKYGIMGLTIPIRTHRYILERAEKHGIDLEKGILLENYSI